MFANKEVLSDSQIDNSQVVNKRKKRKVVKSYKFPTPDAIRVIRMRKQQEIDADRLKNFPDNKNVMGWDKLVKDLNKKYVK